MHGLQQANAEVAWPVVIESLAWSCKRCKCAIAVLAQTRYTTELHNAKILSEFEDVPAD